MDTNLIQTLWLWWGTIPSDFRFLLLLPFAIGGTAVLVDALRQTWIAERRRLFVPRAVAQRLRRIARPRPGRAALQLHSRPEFDDAVVGQVEVVRRAARVAHHRGEHTTAPWRHAGRA
jgi:hypothetical protein